MLAQKIRPDPHQRRWRRRNLEIPQEHGGEQLVHQNSAMLRIVAEFDDVKVAVIRLQQMGLRASSHFSDVPDGGERHQKENAVT